jgi:predicted dinucleotide-binding enzyme
MKVGIIGSGVVAQTLGAGFLKHGYEVALGTRDPAKLKDWSSKHKGVAVKSFAEVAAFGDVVVLAVAGEVAHEALKQAGAATIAGKTVIDACNPIGGGPPVNGVLSYFTAPERIADGAAAEGLSVGPFRQSVQFRRQWADGQSPVRRRQTNDVHLRQ